MTNPSAQATLEAVKPEAWAMGPVTDILTAMIGQPLEEAMYRLFAADLTVYVRWENGKDHGKLDGSNPNRVSLKVNRDLVIGYETG